jgi:hypothetical protein
VYSGWVHSITSPLAGPISHRSLSTSVVRRLSPDRAPVALQRLDTPALHTFSAAWHTSCPSWWVDRAGGRTTKGNVGSGGRPGTHSERLRRGGLRWVRRAPSRASHSVPPRVTPSGAEHRVHGDQHASQAPARDHSTARRPAAASRSGWRPRAALRERREGPTVFGNGTRDSQTRGTPGAVRRHRAVTQRHREGAGGTSHST